MKLNKLIAWLTQAKSNIWNCTLKIIFYFTKPFFDKKKTANLCTINELTDELLEKNFYDINDKESSEWKESDDE